MHGQPSERIVLVANTPGRHQLNAKLKGLGDSDSSHILMANPSLVDILRGSALDAVGNNDQFRYAGVTDDLWTLDQAWIAAKGLQSDGHISDDGSNAAQPTLIADIQGVGPLATTAEYLPQFRANNPLIYHILQNTEGVVCAGSAAMRALRDSHWSPGDFDLFVYRGESEEGPADLPPWDKVGRILDLIASWMEFGDDELRDYEVVRRRCHYRFDHDHTTEHFFQPVTRSDTPSCGGVARRYQLLPEHIRRDRTYKYDVAWTFQVYAQKGLVTVWITPMLGQDILDPIKIQIILRDYSTLSEVLHGFDLGSCSVAFDGDNVYFTGLGRVL